jgi:hypothetical protein
MSSFRKFSVWFWIAARFALAMTQMQVRWGGIVSVGFCGVTRYDWVHPGCHLRRVAGVGFWGGFRL